MRRSDILLLLVLTLGAFWRWGGTVATPSVLPDEWVYVQAARHLEAGRSPYTEPIYFYLPPVASFVHRSSSTLGEIGALQVLRAASLCGLVIAVFLSLRGVAWSWFVRLPAGLLFISFAPAVRLATGIGNVAGLACGLVLLGLLNWQRLPLLSGFALGLGLAIKPIAPLAPLLLAFHRPTDAKRRHLVATAACIVAGIGVCAGGLKYLPGLLDNAEHPTSPYNFSLHKVLIELGLETPALLVPALVAGAALILVRRRRLSAHQLLDVAVTTSLVALPILWAHSLLLLLPAQLSAIDRSVQAFGEWRSLGRRRQVEVMLALLAVASTLLSHAVGSTSGLPSWGSDMARIVPLLSIPYLGWFTFPAGVPVTTESGLLD